MVVKISAEKKYTELIFQVCFYRAHPAQHSCLILVLADVRVSHVRNRTWIYKMSQKKWATSMLLLPSRCYCQPTFIIFCTYRKFATGGYVVRLTWFVLHYLAKSWSFSSCSLISKSWPIIMVVIIIIILSFVSTFHAYNFKRILPVDE